MGALLCLVLVKSPCLHVYMLSYLQNHTTMSRPKRSPNFTNAEIIILTEEVEKRKDIIFSKHNSTVTNQAKKREWDLICTKVNSVNSSFSRTADDLKKKWSVLCSDTKNFFPKLNERKEKPVVVNCRRIVLLPL